MTTKDQILQALQKNFNIEHVEIQDQSSLHLNHSEAQKSGGGHFSLLIVSLDFEGQSLLKRHQMIYQILKPKFSTEIHALAIKALTPQEFTHKD